MEMGKEHPIKPRRRGSVLPQGILFGALVGVGTFALAIDTGYMFISRAELQRALDSSALAGASGLKQGTGTVISRANAFAASHDIAGDALLPSETTVTIGNWIGEDRAFTPADGTETVTPNAVQVDGTRTGITMLFASFVGVDTTDVKRSATAVLGSGVCQGIWGLEGVTSNGNLYVDSYNSSEGAYGPGNAYPNGDLCSCQDVGLSGSVEIHGDVMHGEGYGFNTNGGAFDVFGVLGETECNPVVPPYDMDDAAVNNDNASIGMTDRGVSPFRGGPADLFLTATDNLTLAPGDYYFTSVRMTGTATLTITGPTNIYVSGDGDFTGGGVTNVTQDPTALTIYSDGATLRLMGTAGFYGVAIAPNTDVTLVGTNDFYGAILGRVVDLSSTTSVHVDEQVIADVFGESSVAPVLVE